MYNWETVADTAGVSSGLFDIQDKKARIELTSRKKANCILKEYSGNTMNVQIEDNAMELSMDDIKRIAIKPQ